MRALSEFLNRIDDDITFVLRVRNPDGFEEHVIQTLSPHGNRFIITDRSDKLGTIPDAQVEYVEDPQEAVRYGLSSTDSDDTVVVTGKLDFIYIVRPIVLEYYTS